MSRNTHPFRTLALVAATVAASLAPTLAHAEDIEVYVGSGGDLGGVQPNILFVIDTSGSMQEIVSQTQDPYNPALTYSGSCSSSRIYFDDDSNFPSCSTDQYIDIGKFYCNAATTPFSTVGYFQDRFGSWRNQSGTSNDRWVDPSGGNNSRETDCKSDSGVHGNGGTAKYAADQSNGPWNSSAGNSINWNNRGVFTFMTGNYLNYYNNPPNVVITTRTQMVKQAAKDVMDSITNVNAGLMRFSSDADGGMIVYPISDLDTNRTALKAAVDALPANGSTPLSETLYEAGLYWRGAAVDFGTDSTCSTGVSCPSVAASRGNGDNDLADAGDNLYKTPIEFQCQKNFTVFLSDGEPTSDTGAGTKIQAQPGYSGIGSCSTSVSGDCLDNAAKYLYERDLISSMNGTQNVITYTIGVNIDIDLLEDTAEDGGGTYFVANDSLELVSAFTNIITEILAVNTTFTAPAVSVNAFNRTVHLNQLYFTIFKPSERPHWDGNVKRFDLALKNGAVEIVDQENDLAVDANTGFFADDATSFWTAGADAPDGGEAGQGGAASKLTLGRSVYTYLGTNTNLANASNAVAPSNASITKAMIGDAALSDAERDNIINWLSGIDVNDDDDDSSTTDARRIMGDPLHSKPVVITYGGTSASPDLTIYFTTNDGYLHAIDADDGSEVFSFIPTEVMTNANNLFNNLATYGSKIYGLDGSTTAWVNDTDKDGVIESGDGDFVRLIFGQRRGGNNYWALDVTNRSAPQFMWKITGGAGNFVEMGQTWSDPTLAKVKIGTTTKDVLIFGGGYDTIQDGSTTYQDDTIGRAVYMVDAETGARLWWAGPTGSGANLVLADMESSIPANIRVADMNNDGLADRMYFGDMGGRVFRMDIINGNAASSLVSGGMIAALGGGELATPTDDNSRRFYYAPDIAVIRDRTLGTYLHIGIGSGYREHPLLKTQTDRFFAMRDTNVYNIPASYAYGIVEANLYDITANVIGEGSAAAAAAAQTILKSSKGWYINLLNGTTKEGEKVLAEARTVAGQVLFTTFTPVATTAATETCAPSQGAAKLYVVNAANALPVADLNQSGSTTTLTAGDRARTLVRGGIPPEVTILYPEISQDHPIGLVGPEKVPVDLSNEPVKTYWLQEDSDDGD